ncbi:O-succinylbenzoate synthase [Nocardiopsis gilva YIM 90087]|uniref:O-succinylbenzoate synthase n=1 Tax=Nocardiopsis gilva YIM 90087 TaxID=1235441 RepID=A0A223S527_9ACTN|nr:enolase C-terminal domain-like protein [Nocardiopsis gilva]ASU83224.1 O-succinylbenzoate synthase [Nocardiopsis gilva YIM 90087]
MSRTEPATVTRVATIDATLVRLPPAHPRSGARAAERRPRQVQHALVRVTDDNGVCGWGEIPAVDADRWRALVDGFSPALLRHSWMRPTEAALAWVDLPHDPAVASGLDVACWDLWSKQRGTPLSHALGGERTAITAGVTIDRQPSLDSMVLEVNRQVGSGFRRIRLEIEPGWDVEPIRAVQESFPFLVLQVTGRGRYTEDPADLEALRALDEYGLLAVEQPFADDDLAAHARLRRDMRTTIALDTSVDSLATLDDAIRLEAAGALNLRVARMGGLTPARRAHDRAADAGWDVWCGSDGESGIGRAAIVALASLPGISLPSEMPGAGGIHARDVAVPPVRAHDGITPIPLTQPGLGHEIDARTLRALAVRSVTLDHQGSRPADAASLA